MGLHSPRMPSEPHRYCLTAEAKEHIMGLRS